ncbi:MAG: hydroxyphenylacetyl-CoA thioesterase PaaI [Gammaproteobacteria bacterium]|nr:hydroxyphenylacetyl-CoA thioesterase PaaI [Gammaproteobacteria bacterium]
MNPQELATACADSMYSNDRASQGLGMVIETVGPGVSRMSMPVREDMLNGHDVCHGGFIFALADSCFAFACNSHNNNTLAAGARIEFLAPAKQGDTLAAAASEVALGGRTGIYDVVVSNQHGERVALFRGNSHRIKGNLVNTATGETEQ